MTQKLRCTCGEQTPEGNTIVMCANCVQLKVMRPADLSAAPSMIKTDAQLREEAYERRLARRVA